MSQDEKLQLWIEQGTVNMSQLFFRKYKQLNIEDHEAMFVLQLVSFQTDGHAFPTPQDFADRMHLTVNQVAEIIQKLMQNGYLKITKNQDHAGVHYETYSLQPLWIRLTEQEIQKKETNIAETQQMQEGELFKLFEQEFGRFLSPMEVETISMWLDEDGHTIQIIHAALREAVIAQKVSLRYIDRILFEWKKKNIRSLADVEKHAKNFRTNSQQTYSSELKQRVKPVQFYNWLEERE